MENIIYHVHRNGKWTKKYLKELHEGDIIVSGPAKLLFRVVKIHETDDPDKPELSLDILKRQPSIWQWSDE